MAFVILTINKPSGKKEVVEVMVKMTKEECEAEASDATFQGDEDAIWYCFRNKLVEYPMAYGACYLSYKITTDSVDRTGSKIIWVTWNPEDAKPLMKMKYSSTDVTGVNGQMVKVQAGEKGEVTHSEIVKDKGLK